MQVGPLVMNTAGHHRGTHDQCYTQGRLLMPQGDMPEDCGIESWEVKRGRVQAGLFLAHRPLSMVDEFPVGAAPSSSSKSGSSRKAQLGVQVARQALSMGDRTSLRNQTTNGRTRDRWNVSQLPRATGNVLLRLRRVPKLSAEVFELVDSLFKQIDRDGSADITRSEAARFFGAGFGNMSANAMFSEVDVNSNAAISEIEFRSFWEGVKQAGYSDDDIVEELEELLKGGVWVDFHDGRNTVQRGGTFSGKQLSVKNGQPKRRWDVSQLPKFAGTMLHRLRGGSMLAPEVAALIEDIFRRIDTDGSAAVTRGEAQEFFGSGFGKMSVDAMFNECDTDNNCTISMNEFRAFWQQVRKAGYSDSDIAEELQELLSGGAWVDFKDRRCTVQRGGTFSAKHLSTAEAQAPVKRAIGQR